MYISRTEHEVMMDIHEKTLHNIPYIELKSFVGAEKLKNRRAAMIEIDNQYGKFKYDTEKAITFPNGMLGLEGYHVYGLKKLEEANMNYMLLQSLEDANISFLVMPLIINADGIQLEDATAVCKQLGVAEYEKVIFLGILSMDSKEITINLKAPIVLDCERQLAWQTVMKSDKYELKHSLVQMA